MDKKDAECCPKFDPTPWDNKIFNWENKRFIKDKVWTFLFMPINFGSVMTRVTEKAEKAGANTPDPMCLSDHTSRFRMDVYLEVNKEVPGANNVFLSGKYLSRVYEGDFKDTGKWCEDFDKYIKSKNMTIKKMYMWYTTCPKCAKKYGKNYTVIIAQI